MKKRYKNMQGITLVVLVVTIIILLILAGISISSLKNTGIFEKTKEAKEKMENAELDEQKLLTEYEKNLNENIAEKMTEDKINKVLSKETNTIVKDENENIIVVPAGFKIIVNDTTNNATTVDKGIVIEDATVNEDGSKTATNGSQFVWVPIGNIKKEDGTDITINLGRYYFKSETGEEIPTEGSEGIEEDRGNKKTELLNYGNVISKNLSEFKESVLKNGGYYIGRYEARTNVERTAYTEPLTQITEKKEDNVYNLVTQPQAAKLAQNMYNSANFTSDLINSYAWETTILFIQKFTAQTKYAYQASLNKEFLAKGTDNDIECNIYDIASNVWEWTTETTTSSNTPCIGRGGSYYYDFFSSITRNSGYTNGTAEHVGFRPILYLK